VRVILADDARLFRDALASALSARGHEIVRQVADATELLAAVASLEPELAIVDIRMPPDDARAGLDAALKIRADGRRTAVLLLSQYVETAAVVELLGQDAVGVGYLLKDRVSDVAELEATMDRLAAGGSAIDPAVVSAWLNQKRQRGPLDDLSPRELEVLRVMAEGRSNAAIAAKLFLTVRTVETHVASILSKLDLPPTEADHRRVLAVVRWFESTRSTKQREAAGRPRGSV
jgi:DNA-binding NarL/FixJ family response regulator